MFNLGHVLAHSIIQDSQNIKSSTLFLWCSCLIIVKIYVVYVYHDYLISGRQTFPLGCPHKLVHRQVSGCGTLAIQSECTSITLVR